MWRRRLGLRRKGTLVGSCPRVATDGSMPHGEIASTLQAWELVNLARFAALAVVWPAHPNA